LSTNLIVAQESLESLSAIHSDSRNNLNWNLVFTLPSWLKAWWDSFASGAELYLRSVRRQGKILGVAPLQVRGSTASIIGSVNVCDYQDLIASPGTEKEFCAALLDDLKQNNVKTLELEPLRPDSFVSTFLIPLAQENGLEVTCRASDISMDMELPASFEEYLDRLDGRQRHEVRRKLRNIDSLGEVRYRVISELNAISTGISSFLHLFPEYRQDKAEFLTEQMNNYFRSLSRSLAETGVLRFGSLELSGKPLAMIMYFDYNDNVYLYNSAYDPAYKNMSVGIVSKALCIQDCIQKGKHRFDFLKGTEQYKYYLGGQEIPLARCVISIQ
jgi:CelD/BcsL family acetyltransferase involved in cellulose biosynthesis